jgi:hypothetical protein
VKEISTVKIPMADSRDDAMIRASAFPPTSVADKGRVQMGTYTPLFPAPQAK